MNLSGKFFFSGEQRIKQFCWKQAKGNTARDKKNAKPEGKRYSAKGRGRSRAGNPSGAREEDSGAKEDFVQSRA